MDYDDELRLSCAKTGDPLNKRLIYGLIIKGTFLFEKQNFMIFRPKIKEITVKILLNLGSRAFKIG